MTTRRNARPRPWKVGFQTPGRYRTVACATGAAAARKASSLVGNETVHVYTPEMPTRTVWSFGTMMRVERWDGDEWVVDDRATAQITQPDDPFAGID